MTSNGSKCEFAVLSLNLQVSLVSATLIENAPFEASGTACEKLEFCLAEIGQNLKSPY